MSSLTASAARAAAAIVRVQGQSRGRPEWVRLADQLDEYATRNRPAEDAPSSGGDAA